MSVETVDLAFSLGFSCGGTQSLRAAGLQFVSYPLDWVGSPGIVASARMVATGFADWFRKEDLRLYAVRGGAIGGDVYLNERTRFGFPHDFHRRCRFEEEFPGVADRYDRRIGRFLASARAASSLLALFVERPIDACRPDGDLLEARRILAETFPQARIGLLYFHRVAGASAIVERKPADGVTTVGCDYAKFDHGEISHEIAAAPIVGYLRSHFALACPPDPSDEAAHAREARLRRRALFACGSKNPLARKANEIKYRLYRRLERELREKGLLPRDYPLWFY